MHFSLLPSNHGRSCIAKLMRTRRFLRYNATAGEYTYSWMTEKAWANTYRELVVKLASGEMKCPEAPEGRDVTNDALVPTRGRRPLLGACPTISPATWRGSRYTPSPLGLGSLTSY
jgi:hypothetical protein